MHIVIFRFSAMGDVALTVPVIRGVLNDNQDIVITVVTKKLYATFFEGIERLHVYSADFKHRHKGFFGLFRLYFELRKQADFDLVIDLHSVIRSRTIAILYKLAGKKVATIKKDRKLKLSYTNSDKAPGLPHAVERYSDVFIRGGLNLKPMQPPVFAIKEEQTNAVMNYLATKNLQDKQLIGIAPFAKHELKRWPIVKVRKLIEILIQSEKTHIFLFGGGKQELEALHKIAEEFSACSVVELSLRNELALIQKLHVMISMDSGNMHLASLSGIPVISIWGATHPGIGFGPWFQTSENLIQISKSELICRPCTVYGKGICKRGDFACMEWITPEMVASKIRRIIESE